MNLFQINQEKEKNKEQMQLLTIAFLAGIGYYLFFFLPEQRSDARKEIEEMFRINSITPTELDPNLWKGFKSWPEKLTELYFPSQISKFSENIREAIEVRKKEIEERRFRSIEEEKESAVKELEAYCSEEEKNWPIVKKIIERYSNKIKRSEINNISTLQEEANKLIIEERTKNQRLHWKRKIERGEKSWTDLELLKIKDKLEESWTKQKRDGAKKANIAASYTIYFPPSLWNDLTEEQKSHEKATEFRLRDDVYSYEFNDKITEWYDKVKINPVRGEKDHQSQKDNNALFYGTGGTGKSITAEKLAYEADIYPLVVVKGMALTPKLPDQKYSIAVYEKFIYTIADINWTLIDDFSFQRSEGGEVRHILFIDEADQISENSLIKESTGLTFLKECMGSDNYKENESWNLWIMATNHLKKIDEAVYRPGRLSNPLDFSWTLGDFMRYADKERISRQFPDHWLKEATLSDEDNKWVNRFNTMSFNDEFLPFWRKFISANPDAEYEPEESKNRKKIKIKWGEMFEFFWRLYDSNQLKSFEGKFTNPRQPKIEEVLGTRLKELAESVEEFRKESQEVTNDCTAAIEKGLEDIRLMMEKK